MEPKSSLQCSQEPVRIILPMLATYSAHRILLDFVIIIIFGELIYTHLHKLHIKLPKSTKIHAGAETLLLLVCVPFSKDCRL
jgi:hypothetical protein